MVRETALLDSLEGRRGHPRLKPPFPAAQGLYARPTVINNVETISQVAGIFKYSDNWYAAMGTEKSKGHGIFSVSGHVAPPRSVRGAVRDYDAATVWDTAAGCELDTT
ncbi:NADH-quinone oxidoreductase subunit 1 [Mobiluncus curtisii]|uniref:NADH-quinone oxidoreductase subunit 1 n=1 Tax=Mobiluncus curtisii TaxID=2051 RepID=A0A2X3BLP5_9ACTO|nr:NADH-quinone oxidoreductase subunit 1 [Mobiluncus curtisii]